MRSTDSKPPNLPQRHLHSFFQSKFYAPQKYFSLPASRLTNSIHALFRPEAFLSQGLNYEKLQTTLQLATNLLETALPFFHNVFFSECTQFEHKGLKYARLPATAEQLTDEQTHATCEALLEMAQDLTYRVLEPDEGRVAYCENRRGDAHRVQNCKHLHGYQSTIKIPHKYVHRIYNADPGDVISVQWYAFYLAATLLHELAHASVASAMYHYFEFQGFVVGDLPHSEEGFALEEWLFGGTFDKHLRPSGSNRIYFHNGTASKLSTVIVFTQGADPAALVGYQEQDIVTPSLYVRPGSLPKVFVRWLVDCEYISNMFQDSFWRGQVSQQGRFALHPSRMVGYRMMLNPKNGNKLGPYPPLFEQQDPAIAVPNGFWLDAHGLVYAKIPEPPEFEMTSDLEMPPEIEVPLDFEMPPGSQQSSLRRYP